MSGLINFFTNWKFLLILFAAVCINGLWIFPAQFSQIEKITKQKFVPLDTRFSYSQNDVKSLFQKLKPKGRKLYREILSKYDTIFPVLYGSLLALLIVNCLDRLSFTAWPLYLLALLPIFAIVFDWIENSNTMAMIDNFQKLTKKEVTWGEQATQLKYASLLLSAGVLLTLYSIRIFDHKTKLTPLNTRSRLKT